MRAQLVDPRDTRWEDDSPVYRVYFWAEALAPAEIPRTSVGWESEEYEIREAMDVEEVIAWAQGSGHGGRAFTVYISLERNGAPGLVRIAGADPTRG